MRKNNHNNGVKQSKYSKANERKKLQIIIGRKITYNLNGFVIYIFMVSNDCESESSSG